MDEKTFFYGRQSRVPYKYKDCCLEKCDKQPIEVIEYGKQWALNPKSIFLEGGYGSGKTTYGFALLREMFRKNKRILWPWYYTSPDLDEKLLEAIKSDQGDSFVVENIATQDILFVDDLGRETKSDRLKKQYFKIFDYRYANELPTIITSNFTVEKLADILDGALISRMQEWDYIYFEGKDLRKPTQNDLKAPTIEKKH